MAASPPHPHEVLEDPDGPIGGRARRRRERRRHGHVIGVVVLIALALSAGSAAAVIVLSNDPAAVLRCDLSTMRPHGLGGDTMLTASDGTTLGFIPTAMNREPIAAARMSQWLPMATVDVEDRRFWQHGALDPLGVVRSAFADLTAGHVVQGASTITQQLVRNRYLPNERINLSRKITEACLAVQLFDRWPRQRILEEYLNTVYYGHHARGVEAASWTYFDRPARRLTLAQAALLAGLPQAPSDFDPILHPKAARTRRAEVLKSMFRAHDITRRRYRRTLRAPLELHPGDRYQTVQASTFFSAARNELVRRFGSGRVRHGALRVQTTLSTRLQATAQRAIGNWIGKPGDPSAALVAINPRNGDVLAAATSTPGVSNLSFNLITQSRRQAGSAFKPFTLATALKQGIPLSSVWHGPSSLTIPNRECLNANGPWVVHNFADEATGTMDLIGGIAHSVNTIFAQVAVKVGPKNIVQTAEQMGIRSPLKPVCSITLGPEGVSPLDMADAYATLASGGIHHAPQLLAQVQDRSGRSLLGSRPHGDRALPADVAAKVTYALSAVIRGGTGTAADIGRPASGKTGTAESEVDAWFCGYTPQLTACVWIGYPHSETTMTSVDGFSPVVGGSVPARIWHDFMLAALAGHKLLPMPQVSSVPKLAAGSSSGTTTVPGASPGNSTTPFTLTTPSPTTTTPGSTGGAAAPTTTTGGGGHG